MMPCPSRPALRSYSQRCTFGTKAGPVLFPIHPFRVLAIPGTTGDAPGIAEAWRSGSRSIASVHRPAKLVGLVDVFAEHPGRRETGPDGLQGPLDHGDPAMGNAGRVALVEEWHDLVLEDVEKSGAVPLILDVSVEDDVPRQPPTVVAVEALDPPAVEDGKVEDAVHGGFHATGAARLERWAG